MTAPGRLVAGRYRLQGHIGGGGMGTVWLADDERLGREVAIKEILPPAGADPSSARQQRERTLREGRIAARLSHPHAISVYDVVVDDDQPWLVMEYLPSRSLAAVLAEDGLLQVDQAAQIGAQVADALVATHAAGIVHRDVKPANVLIGSGERIDGLVKITDFGISHATGDVTLTQTGQITGTPAYLAPEVAQGMEPGPVADVFSLGATLYACTEGQPPFGRSDNALQQLHRAAAGTIEPPRRSGALTGPLLQMLAVDPAVRPDMAHVRDELSVLAAGHDGDATAVLAAPTDITTQDLGDARARGAAPAVGEAPDAPVAATGTLPDETGFGRRLRRRAPLGWVAAAVVAVLAGLAAWALVPGTDPDTDPDTDIVAPEPTASTTPPTSEPDPDAPAAEGDPDPGSAAPGAEGDPDPVPSTTTPGDAAGNDVSGGNGDGATVEAGAIEPDAIEQYLDEYHRAVVDDPAAAYEQAGPTLRSSISAAGFEDFWAPFDDVAISDVEVDEGGDSALADMELRYPDGTRQVERHRFRFVVEDGRLVLDRDDFVEMISSRG
jgi:hypothetical protein